MNAAWTWRAGAALIFCLVAAGAWSIGQGELAPGAINERAGANVYDLAAAFAAAGWPAGFEILEEDQPTDRLPPVVVGTSRVPLSEMLVSINASQPRYVASAAGRVVVVRPRSGGAEYLGRPAPPGEWKVRGVLNAMRKIFAPLSPQLDAGGGQAGSLLGGTQPDDRELTVLTEGRIVIDVLVRLAADAPGTVWFVVTRRTEAGTDIVRIGVMHKNGSTTELPGR